MHANYHFSIIDLQCVITIQDSTHSHSAQCRTTRHYTLSYCTVQDNKTLYTLIMHSAGQDKDRTRTLSYSTLQNGRHSHAVQYTIVDTLILHNTGQETISYSKVHNKRVDMHETLTTSTESANTNFTLPIRSSALMNFNFINIILYKI